MEPMYPSAEELLNGVQWLSKGLQEEIRERYLIHGPEYLTEDLHDDGRKINACMHANSAQDAIEEVVDAIFNVLVLRFKGYSTATPLRQLTESYSSLLAMKAFLEAPDA